MFNANNEIQKIISFIKDIFNNPWISNSGRNNSGGVVIGISGGKDSTVVAALCARAMGKDRVLGVLMPNGEQSDIIDARSVCDFLGIECLEINIKESVAAIEKVVGRPTPYAIPSRVRMTCLYTLAAARGRLVTCNSNLSELTIGYTTKWGDNVGDFAPIAHLTKTEVVALGLTLGLPSHLINKAPADGLTGKSDEENFGFTYAALDDYIRNVGSKGNPWREKIEARIAQNKHKRLPIPTVS